MENVFVYGTLQFPQIVERLTGKIFVGVPATLNGFKRCLVKGADYPAICEKQGAFVKGKLLKNVDENSMHKFTIFEGDEYERRVVEVCCENEMIKAVTFVWRENIGLLEEKDWDENQFKNYSLKKYS